MHYYYGASQIPQKIHDNFGQAMFKWKEKNIGYYEIIWLSFYVREAIEDISSQHGISQQLTGSADLPRTCQSSIILERYTVHFFTVSFLMTDLLLRLQIPQPP